MEINLNIGASSVEELHAALLGLADGMSVVKAARVAPSTEEIPFADVKISEEVPETQAAPTIAPEANPEKIPEPDVKKSDEPDAKEPDKPKEPPTMEETRAVLNELRKKNGAKAVKAILANFSVNSFTDLEPSEYAAVIEEARQAYRKDV